MNQLRLAWARCLFSINIPQEEMSFKIGLFILSLQFSTLRALLQNVSADSDGSRPGFRDDLARHSDLMSLGVPR